MKLKLHGDSRGLWITDNDMPVASITQMSPAAMHQYGNLFAASAALVEACKTAEANLAPAYCSEHIVMKRLRAALALAEGKQ